VCAALALVVCAALSSTADARVKTKTFLSGDLTKPFGSTPPNDRAIAYINVPRSKQGRIKDLDVAVRLDHPADSDLRIFLEHPTIVSGITLSQGNGGDGANYGSGATTCGGIPTIFDDEAATPITAGVPPFASTFQPQTPLSTFDGKKTKGTWALSVIDNDYFTAEAGALYCFALTITYKPA